MGRRRICCCRIHEPALRVQYFMAMLLPFFLFILLFFLAVGIRCSNKCTRVQTFVFRTNVPSTSTPSSKGGRVVSDACAPSPSSPIHISHDGKPISLKKGKLSVCLTFSRKL